MKMSVYIGPSLVSTNKLESCGYASENLYTKQMFFNIYQASLNSLTTEKVVMSFSLKDP